MYTHTCQRFNIITVGAILPETALRTVVHDHNGPIDTAVSKRVPWAQDGPIAALESCTIGRAC